MNITPQQFSDAFAKLPFPIRQYIAGDELGTVVQELGKKYGLHVDTMEGLDREVTNVLLGLMSPEQFMGELKSIGVQAEIIPSLVQEINQQVFVPLQQRIKEHGEEDPHAEDEQILKELADEMKARPSTVSTPPAIQAPAPVPAVSSYLPPAPVAAPAPPPPALVSAPFVVPSPAPAQPTHSFIRTMGEDMQAVHDHQVPQMHPFEQTNVPPAVPVQPVAPAPVPVPPPAPPAPQPVPMPPPPPRPAPVFQAPPAPPVPPQPVQFPNIPRPPAPSVPPAPKSDNHEELRSVLKTYGIDPYREPVE